MAGRISAMRTGAMPRPEKGRRPIAVILPLTYGENRALGRCDWSFLRDGCKILIECLVGKKDSPNLGDAVRGISCD